MEWGQQEPFHEEMRHEADEASPPPNRQTPRAPHQAPL